MVSGCGGGVVFNYSNWALRYPELAASVSSGLAQLYFNEATSYCDNTPQTPFTDIGQLATYLNMVTAHIAALNAPLNGAPSSPLVGRVSNASEGSVSVQTQNDYPPGSAQWFQATKYGAAYWAATSQYRSMLYVPGCVPRTNPFTGRFR